jgi:hypothetical protein
MCKISIDTVRRANKKTIMQIGNSRAYSGRISPRNTFDVSVSVMGKVYSQSISAKQIKSSFCKALENHA